MLPYILNLITSLFFYTAGIISICSGNRGTGAAMIALGCTFFAIALNRKKKK